MISCTQEAIMDSPNENRIPLNISGSINQVHTKATADGFVDRDAVGLYAVNYSENNSVAGTLEVSGNQADNVKYVFNEANQTWVPVRAVYYKNADTHADLYLYYPYQASITDISACNFEVQKDQSAAATSTSLSGYEASDWMWGKGTDITPTESKVQIPLTHRFSAVQVSLSEGTGFEEGEFAALEKSVILSGTTRKATLDFTNGGVTPIGEAQSDGIIMCLQNDGKWRSVVIPQTVESGIKLFAITLGGISYGYSQAESMEYQQGKQRNINLTLSKKTPSGDYEISLGSSEIVDWTEDVNTHGGEARQYYVVNLSSAGTLQATIQADKKNPAKIRNLKITGPVNTDDFVFMRDGMAILEAVNMQESNVVDGRILDVANESNTGVIEEDNVIPAYAFKDKKTLTYFVFPESIKKIGRGAFYNTSLAGTVVLPDDLEYIGDNIEIGLSLGAQLGAFESSKIRAVVFPSGLKMIGISSFYNCTSLSGQLSLPSGVKKIGKNAFRGCSLSGTLHLPDQLEEIGRQAFEEAGSFVGNLSIPEKIATLPDGVFSNCGFSGNLDLGNVTELGYTVFSGCYFVGELIIPEGTLQIQNQCFKYNMFSSIKLPSSLKSIEKEAFCYCQALCEPVIIPEGVLSIGEGAFEWDTTIPSISFPSTLQTIGKQAFSNCYGISGMTVYAVEPPDVGVNAFAGVAKANFTVEVPEASLIRYQTENGWSDFTRISAHQEFSLNRSVVRVLNAGATNSYTLRAPAGFAWSIQSAPDWVNVSPSSGVGKTDLTITVSSMERTNNTFTVNEGTYNSPKNKTYKGRNGEVIFLLDSKNYTFPLNVEQYDSDYYEGYVSALQTHTSGPGIDIVFIGDGYDARDIAKGTFNSNAEDGLNHLFDLEPYNTYRSYFNVYSVVSLSRDSGIGTVNTVKDSKFSSLLTQNRVLCKNLDEAFLWAKNANPSMDLSKSLVIMLMNTSVYEGICYLYGDGSAIACCPVSTNAYPYDFRGIIQHEAGGHGFGKLADEYIYHNGYIMNCGCKDGCDHPQGDGDTGSSFGQMKSKGWYKNLSMSSDPKIVPWNHLIYHSQYSDYVDIFEGGYMHSRGMYRSEATSCMNNNIPYYSAISRQAIVERIKEYSGEVFTLEDFYLHDSNAVGTKASIPHHLSNAWPYNVDPAFNRGSGLGPVYVGERPNVK